GDRFDGSRKEAWKRWAPSPPTVPHGPGAPARNGSPCSAVKPGSTYAISKPKFGREPSWVPTADEATSPWRSGQFTQRQHAREIEMDGCRQHPINTSVY